MVSGAVWFLGLREGRVSLSKCFFHPRDMGGWPFPRQRVCPFRALDLPLCVLVRPHLRHGWAPLTLDAAR